MNKILSDSHPLIRIYFKREKCQLYLQMEVVEKLAFRRVIHEGNRRRGRFMVQPPDI